MHCDHAKYEYAITVQIAIHKSINILARTWKENNVAMVQSVTQQLESTHWEDGKYKTKGRRPYFCNRTNHMQAVIHEKWRYAAVVWLVAVPIGNHTVVESVYGRITPTKARIHAQHAFWIKGHFREFKISADKPTTKPRHHHHNEPVEETDLK